MLWLELLLAGLSNCGYISDSRALCVECVGELCVRGVEWSTGRAVLA